MKNTTFTKSVASALCLAAALAFTSGCASTSSTSAETKTAKGGATELMKLKPIQTGQDVAALDVGDSIVMSCPKCKSTYVTRVTKENKPRQTSTTGVELHACPGCDTKITTHGHGKTAKDVVTHVCKNCGSTDAFCCVIKAGQGSTSGMHHH